MKSTLRSIKKRFNIRKKDGEYDAERFKRKLDKESEKTFRLSKTLSLSITSLDDAKIFEDKHTIVDNYYLEPIIPRHNNDENASVKETVPSNVQTVKPKLQLTVSNVSFTSNDDTVSYKSCLSDEAEYIYMPQEVKDERYKKNSFITRADANFTNGLSDLIDQMNINDGTDQRATRVTDGANSDHNDETCEANNIRNRHASINEDCDYATVNSLAEKYAIEEDILNSVVKCRSNSNGDEDLFNFADGLGSIDENDDEFYSDDDMSKINRFNNYLMDRGIMSVDNVEYIDVNFVAKRGNGRTEDNSTTDEETYLENDQQSVSDQGEMLRGVLNVTVVEMRGNRIRDDDSESNIQELSEPRQIWEDIEENDVEELKEFVKDDQGNYHERNERHEKRDILKSDWKEYDEQELYEKKHILTVNWQNNGDELQQLRQSLRNYDDDRGLQNETNDENSIDNGEFLHNAHSTDNGDVSNLQRLRKMKLLFNNNSRSAKSYEDDGYEEIRAYENFQTSSDDENLNDSRFESNQVNACVEEEKSVIPRENTNIYENLVFQATNNFNANDFAKNKRHFHEEISHEVIVSQLRKSLLQDEEKTEIYEALHEIKNEVKEIEAAINNCYENNEKHRLLSILFKKLRSLTAFDLRNSDEELLDIQRDVLLHIQKCIKQLN